MRPKENGSLINAGMHDIRKTAAEWIQQIDEADKPFHILTIAGALAETPELIVDEEAESVKLYIERDQIVQYALEKYIEIADGGVEKLLKTILNMDRYEKKHNFGDSNTFLGIKLAVIDLVLKKGEYSQLVDLHLFLNAHRNFLSAELLTIKLGEVHRLMHANADTNQVIGNVLDSVSGVINSDSNK